jgi:hypothetical protein
MRIKENTFGWLYAETIAAHEALEHQRYLDECWQFSHGKPTYLYTQDFIAISFEYDGGMQ